MTRAPAALVAAFVLSAGLLAACSSGGGGATPAPKSAAEPASAPAVSPTPAGRVVRIGSGPEGAVYDATTNTIAVATHGPSALELIDGTTGRIRRSVPLPGTVRHLQLEAPGGPVLVPCETANELLEVDLRTGASTSIGVGRSPHDATATTGTQGTLIGVGDEFGGSVSVVSGHSTVRTVTGFTQPGGLAPLPGGRVAVVDVGAYTLSTVDLQSGAVTEKLAAGQGPTHVVALDDDTVAVADTRGNAVLLFSGAPLTWLGRVSLPGSPYGVAVDAATGTLWVTLTGADRVVGLVRDGTTLRQIASYPTVAQPNSVAVAPDSHQVYVIGNRNSQLQIINR